MRIPELLAPAGTLDALLAAVAAGADAVYTGLGAFNARAAAPDLDLATFARACAVAHAHGTRVYVTENVYLREGELDAALDLARAAVGAGADALIVADAGLARRIAAELPDAELHLSTQAGVMSAAGVRLAAAELGAARVTCARELSLAEIADLTATGVPIETFCHGAICICYSGACAFSALRRGRSANRGDCTQPCRLSYELTDGAGRCVSAAAGDRLLCPRDYLSVRHVAELARAGVAALKIEGRMKNPDYVYNVVRTYRAALDALAAGHVLADAEADEAVFALGTSFNRGFTDAYLRGVSGAELMSFERAINQGVRVGTVVEREHREVAVELTGPVRPGDTLEIRTVLPDDAPADVPARWPLVPCEVAGEAGERVRVRCKRRVAPGSPVHLVARAATVTEAADAVAALRAELDAVEAGAGVGDDADAHAAAGVAEGTVLRSELAAGSVAVAGTSGINADGSARSAAHPAANRAVAVAEAADAAAVLPSKLGAVDAAPCVGDDTDTRFPVGIPGDASTIPADAVASAVLLPALATDGAAAIADGDSDADVPACAVSHAASVGTTRDSATPGEPTRDVERVAVASTPAQARHLLATAQVDAVAVRAFELADDAEWEELLDDLVVILDEPCRVSDEPRVRDLCARVAAVVCRNLGAIELARAAGARFEVAAPVSATNTATVRWLIGLGARRVWLPDELSADEARAVVAAAPAGSCGLFVRGVPQLMVCEHCLLTAEGPCTEHCAACPRRRAERFLMEAGGARLPVGVDAFGRTRIFDAVPLDRQDEVDALAKVGLGAVMLDA